MDRILSPHNSYPETLSPNMATFGGRVFREVTKVK